MNPGGLKAIETSYGGCRFRSRLEARWAVFFDDLKIQWFYEPEGYGLPAGAYLPDFWLPHQNLWYEVKGVAPEQPNYIILLEHLAEASKRRVLLAVGDIPRPDQHEVTCGPPFFMEAFYPDGGWDNYQAWCRCPHCGATDVQFMGRAERNCTCQPDERTNSSYDPDILRAYEAARSARFEHGQKPGAR